MPTVAARPVSRPPVSRCLPWSAAARRRLTAGEVSLVHLVFGRAVDVTAVRVHNHGYPWLLGRQPTSTAVTPRGQVYFPAASYRPDFAAAPDLTRRWFVHEMVHVWQHQLGYPVLLRGAVRWTVRYTYDLDPDRRLADYDMEQQGEIVADYYYLRLRGHPSVGGAGATRHQGSEPYETVLQDFLARPGDRTNLPHRTLCRTV